jgi:hypothetical protein
MTYIENDRWNSSTQRAMTTSNKEYDKRAFCKRHCCPFCEISYAIVSRHFAQSHAGKTEVQHMKERKEAIELLHKKGNFHHTWEAPQNKSEFIVPVNRPSKSKEPQNYALRKFCLGFYAKIDLRKHVAQCKLHHLRAASLLRWNAVASEHGCPHVWKTSHRV